MLRDIQEHCCKEHAWTNPRKRGQPYHSKEVGSQLWQEGVWCQKFQRTGPLGRLFEISLPVEVGTQHAAAAGNKGDLQRALEVSFLDSTTALQKAQQDAHTWVEADTNCFLWHSWLRRTQWARYLTNFDCLWLLRQVRQPGNKERALKRVC
jgi:hypothetical protein